MALWDKFKEKEKEKPEEEKLKNLKEEVLKEHKPDYEQIGKTILNIIDTAFNPPDNTVKGLISEIDMAISKNITNGHLDYKALIKFIGKDYDEDLAEKCYAHQLLGAYVAYTLLTGKPLNLRQVLDSNIRKQNNDDE